MIDMSPEFCGIIEGLSGTSSSIQAFLFTWAVNYFTASLAFEELWKMVFLYSTMYLVVASVLFLIFGTSEVQAWNYRGRSEQRKSEDVKNVKSEVTS
ncbi:uncharacterized transporter slc-17.2-like [Planococcus citri]|uniref:uncharacterized transporter slc-17.2-like n=1 Tax=Planococcus citri TaxID=170843 RepID=UPI0031F8DE4A